MTSASSPSPDSARDRTSYLALAAVLLLAAALRVREALLTPFWFDEIYTLRLVRLPFGAMTRAIAGDIHPPLHPLLLWLWRAAGGEVPLWLKLLPILIGLATIAVLFLAAREMFDRPSALLAAGLLALHREHVYFSQEIRGYALLGLTLTLATWMAWRWITRARPRDGWGYALSAAAALYTHYLAGLVLALLALWGLWAARRDPARLRGWVLLHLGVAALFAPDVPLFLRQLQISHEHWMKAPTLANLYDLARQMAFGGRWLIPILGACAALPLMRAHQRSAAALLWWIALAPPLTAFVATQHGAHLFVERYMYFTLPAWCVLFAAGLAGLRPPPLAWAASLAAVALAARALAIHQPLPEAVAVDRAERFVAARARSGDLVVCADTHSLFVFDDRAHATRNQQLLMEWPSLPYYEGAAFVPDSQRLAPAAFADSAGAGRRWWGVRTRHGGISSVAGAALMDSLARGGRFQFEMVTVWAGQPGMSDSTAATTR